MLMGILPGYAAIGLAAPVGMPLSAHISDHVGRKRWFTSETVLMAAFALPYFLLLQTKNPALVLTALIFSIGVCISWLYGPEAALIAEQFSPRLRYSGASLGYQLASIAAGGPAPFIATHVLTHYKTANSGFAGSSLASLLIALYIVLMSLVSLVAVQFLKEYAGKAAGGDQSLPF